MDFQGMITNEDGSTTIKVAESAMRKISIALCQAGVGCTVDFKGCKITVNSEGVDSFIAVFTKGNFLVQTCLDFLENPTPKNYVAIAKHVSLIKE